MITIPIPSYIDLAPIREWCKEQFGFSLHGRWSYRMTGIVDVVFKFKDDADGILFKMRWSDVLNEPPPAAYYGKTFVEIRMMFLNQVQDALDDIANTAISDVIKQAIKITK